MAVRYKSRGRKKLPTTKFERVTIVPDNDKLVEKLKRDLYPGCRVSLECVSGEDRAKSTELAEGVVGRMEEDKIVIVYNDGSVSVPYNAITGYETEGYFTREERRKRDIEVKEDRRKRLKKI